MIMMPSCPYFIFIDTSISKHVDIFFDFGFSLEDKRGLRLGELIHPFCIMLLYQYLLHYGLLLHIMSQYLCLFSLILQGLHKEGECRQLGFWLEKEKILETYSAQLQKSWNFTDDVFQIYKKHWMQELHQGGTPCIVGPLVAPRYPSSAIWSLLSEKNS